MNDTPYRKNIFEPVAQRLWATGSSPLNLRLNALGVPAQLSFLYYNVPFGKLQFYKEQKLSTKSGKNIKGVTSNKVPLGEIICS